MPLKSISWTNVERELLLEAISKLSYSLRRPASYSKREHDKQRNHLMKLFWEDNREVLENNNQNLTYFPPELIILYELLSIYNQVDNFHIERSEERRVGKECKSQWWP